MTSPMTYSKTGLQLTESFEGLRLNAYYDLGGVLTIGYGHTGPDVTAGQQITPSAGRGVTEWMTLRVPSTASTRLFR